MKNVDLTLVLNGGCLILPVPLKDMYIHAYIHFHLTVSLLPQPKSACGVAGAAALLRGH